MVRPYLVLLSYWFLLILKTQDTTQGKSRYQYDGSARKTDEESLVK